MSQSRKWLDIETCGIGSLLIRPLRLPLNQREYSWEPVHVSGLFSDFSDTIASDNGVHFLGTIVLTHDNEDIASVVDGQQRLATTTILLAAIRDYYLANGHDKLATSIEQEFLCTIDPATGDDIPKFRLNHDDNEYFQNRIVARKSDRIEMTGKKLASHSRIDKAAEIAESRVNAIAKNSNEPLTRLLEWRKFVTDKAVVLVIRPLTDMDAFRMFETLNDRGLKTTQLDMLKNYLFDESSPELTNAQSYWSRMRGAIESFGDEDIMLTYMRHFTLAIYGPVLKNNDLVRNYEHADFYARIKGSVKGSRQSLAFLDQLARCSDDYVAILSESHPKWNSYDSYSEDISNAIQVIRELKVSQIRPLMLSVAMKFSPEEACKAFRSFVCWTVRFLVSGGMRGQTLEDAYAKTAHQITSGAITKAREMRSQLRSVIPSDAEFEAAFRTASVSQEYLARYYLRAIEATLKKFEGPPELEPIRNAMRLNLEHILPKKIDAEHWPIREDEAKPLLKRIGNLTLMAAKSNAEEGNGPFKEKKNVYQKSALMITRSIATNFPEDNWGSQEIQKRQDWLALLAVKTWPLSFEAD